uniref:Bactericidal permeability-increasing protein n=1 Tax=Periophthalmus magnuspinnatus TaxID=409849 RepID=A0A3B4AMH9_9GOBI
TFLHMSHMYTSMLLHAWLLLVALTTLTSGLNPGVKVKLTQKGLEYGRELGIASIQQKLKTIKLPDVSGSQKVNPIGKVSYSFTNMHIINVGLPQSAVSLVPGAGIKLSIGNAYLSLNGNWRVKYLKFIGSFDLSVSGLSITTTVAVNSDETGRPTFKVNSQSDNSVLLLSSWLYNLFKDFIAKALRSALEKQVKQLQLSVLQETSVLAKVDEYAEIQYSLVSSPVISTTSVDLSLKVNYSHQEPPFIPNVFSMPPESNNMLYLGLSSYTANSAGFVYTTAGALSLYITDDMVSFFTVSPIRLNTQTFGAFIPQVTSLCSLFANLVTAFCHNEPIVKARSFALFNYRLPNASPGYPLPTIGKMKLVNTQLQIMKVSARSFIKKGLVTVAGSDAPLLCCRITC